MTKHEIVLIEWHDAMSEGPGWVPKEQVDTNLAVCQSVGFVIKEDKEKITIVGSCNETDYSQTITIPKSWIIKIKKLRSGGNYK